MVEPKEVRRQDKPHLTLSKAKKNGTNIPISYVSVLKPHYIKSLLT